MDSIRDVCRIEHLFFGEPFLIKREVCWSCFTCLHVFENGWLSSSSTLTVVWCVRGLPSGATGSTVRWIRWCFICTDGKSVPHTLLSHRVQQHDWTCTAPWHVFQLCVTTLQMTMTTTHLGMVIEQTSGDPCAMARVPTKQAMHAPRTKTRDYKMESQRQESKTMNHLKSRTKPLDTRPNLNHRCKSMTRTENHVPLIIANTTTGHATRPPTRIANDENTEQRATKSPMYPGHKQTKNEVKKSYDTPSGKFEKSSSSLRNVRNACIGRVPLSRTAPTRNFDGSMSVPIRCLAQQVRRGNATHQSPGRRDVCRTGMKRATTARGGVSIAHARSDR